MDTQLAPIYHVILGTSLFWALSVSTITDLVSRRIPNFASLGLATLALITHSFFSGWEGFLFSLGGLGTGFGLLFFPHLLGGIGAGDVKLMAAVGAVFGPAQTFFIFLVIALIGGITSMAILVVRKDLFPVCKRIGLALMAAFGGTGLQALQIAPETLTQKGIPYGAVITAGTVSYIAYKLMAGKGIPLI